MSVHDLCDARTGDNARLFRRLSNQLTIDLLDNRNLMPFGDMTLNSTLMVIGAQALFAIMWLVSDTDPRTTIPGLVATAVPLVFLFLAPVWPIHLALRQAKQAVLARIQDSIKETRGGDPLVNAEILGPLLTYRREVATVAEWPFNLSIVARFGLYPVIVPITWIGAAFIENLVEVFI
ncbi:MAG: hypothetical protein QF921_09595 [Pseudomonadales bacterium]|jgi:hypothetical protein|nr:hypothetical protein [Pseudomonadales bacterium]MDP6470255.1 hypothetical protein [Pseudomonadales bacterium]MDP6827161.1 hypothetical protein [Pseudomonadales bacterium]MDP6971747.1 hypothetical protein [Pseudomonadales bacterium]|tara:strand:+ start:1432 stop:1965 length:534 start_codon:yes stop_codon:yes gene_type:complete